MKVSHQQTIFKFLLRKCKSEVVSSSKIHQNRTLHVTISLIAFAYKTLTTAEFVSVQLLIADLE
jgi:ABC-type uncharacterized transport system permease subunit